MFVFERERDADPSEDDGSWIGVSVCNVDDDGDAVVEAVVDVNVFGAVVAVVVVVVGWDGGAAKC